MNEQFCNYEISKKLKELGFEDECLGFYSKHNQFHLISYGIVSYNNTHDSICIHPLYKLDCAAPLWQQVIDWLREKHDIDVEIHSKFGQGNGWWSNLCYNSTRTETLNVGMFDNYCKAREQAILKALEIIKSV